MRIRKQYSFDSPTELLERILNGGIVICPAARLQVVEGGVRGSRLVIETNDVDGVLAA